MGMTVVGVKRHLLTTRETILIFTAVLIPVQLWMFYNLLMAFPAYRVRLLLWDLVGVIAYTQAFVLFESLLVFAGLAALMMVAPLKWRGDRFIAGLSMLIFTASFWSILIHLKYDTVIEWGVRQIGVWLLIILATGVVLVWATVRNARMTDAVIAFLDRATVLTALYLGINVLCVMIVGLRNIIVIGKFY